MSDSPAPAPHRPKSWIALLLSVFFPGLGHIYAGAPQRGLLAMAAMVTINIAGFILAARAFWLLLAVLVVGILVWLVILYDALRLCRRAPARAPHPFQRWYVYVVIAVGYVAVNIAFDVGARATVGTMASYRVSSKSMQPTLQPGDLFQVMQRDDAGTWLRRGDVIVFRTQMGADYVKRVAGIAGDRITFRNGLPQLNGRPVPHAPLPPDDPDAKLCTQGAVGYKATLGDGRSYATCVQAIGDFENRTYVVPPDHVFVLGDDLGNSLDSRMPQVGFVALADVKGRVQYIHWSSNLVRIGRRVD